MNEKIENLCSKIEIIICRNDKLGKSRDQSFDPDGEMNPNSSNSQPLFVANILSNFKK